MEISGILHIPQAFSSEEIRLFAISFVIFKYVCNLQPREFAILQQSYYLSNVDEFGRRMRSPMDSILGFRKIFRLYIPHIFDTL